MVFASSLPYSTVLFVFIQVIACFHRDQFAHRGKNNVPFEEFKSKGIFFLREYGRGRKA